MLFEFSQGFKQANRSVFVDTYTNYHFAKATARRRALRRSCRPSCWSRSTACTTRGPPAGA